MLTPFDAAAMAMLEYARIKKSVSDVKILSDDLLRASCG